MKISKSISALILSLVLVLGSFGTAHAKRLTAAVADWTGGEITCQVAVSCLLYTSPSPRDGCRSRMPSSA